MLLVEALPLPWFPKVNIGRGTGNYGIKCVFNLPHYRALTDYNVLQCITNVLHM